MDLHSILIDSIQSYVFDPNDFTEYVDTTGIYYRAIKEIDAPYSYSSYLTDISFGTKVSFKCSQDDMIGRCDINNGLFHNFNYSLCVAPKYANEIGYEYYNYEDQYLLVPGCVIDEFITGRISPTPPTSLPAPELSYSIEHRSGHSMGGFLWGDYTAKLDFKMPIVNQDHTLLDPLNLYIKLFENGELINNFSFYNFGNPFNFAHRYAYKLAEWIEDPITGELLNENPLMNNVYQALIYYKDSDGTIVESPKALLKYPSDADSITEIAAPEPIHDGKTYDLTGREVNPDALAPGIYIRNGRKFAVAR
ncbi:MAG: hypothetical protein K2G67_06430 [Muribaculaceae bacterium]|nr:hypothetical protein [Muribaculaceae bacterium]